MKINISYSYSYSISYMNILKPMYLYVFICIYLLYYFCFRHSSYSFHSLFNNSNINQFYYHICISLHTVCTIILDYIYFLIYVYPYSQCPKKRLPSVGFSWSRQTNSKSVVFFANDCLGVLTIRFLRLSNFHMSWKSLNMFKCLTCKVWSQMPWYYIYYINI